MGESISGGDSISSYSSLVILSSMIACAFISSSSFLVTNLIFSFSFILQIYRLYFCILIWKFELKGAFFLVLLQLNASKFGGTTSFWYLFDCFMNLKWRSYGAELICFNRACDCALLFISLFYFSQLSSSFLKVSLPLYIFFPFLLFLPLGVSNDFICRSEQNYEFQKCMFFDKPLIFLIVDLFVSKEWILGLFLFCGFIFVLS